MKSEFESGQHVRITEFYPDSPEGSEMFGKTGRVEVVIGKAYNVRIDEGQGQYSGRIMTYDDNTLERINPKQRLTMYAVGVREGVEDEPFRKALESGSIAYDTAGALSLALDKQVQIGYDRAVGIWCFDIYVDPDNLPKYWNV